MSPHELSRIVNDALQNGDFAAALAPLQAEPNLRASEFPRLEKKSLTALTKALQDSQNAQFWAQQLLNTTDAAHIFVYRTLSRLEEATQPIATPLRQMVLDIWSKDTPPTAQISDAKTQKLRTAQEQALAHALEFMLSFDTDSTLELCLAQAQIFLPIELAHQDLRQVQSKRAEAGHQALYAALSDALPAWRRGQELSSFQLANAVPHEIYREAYNRPEIRQLFEFPGESPEQWLRKHWNPLETFRSALNGLGHSKQNPQKIALGKVGTFLRHHVTAGLQESGDTSATEISATIALTFLNCVAHFDDTALRLAQLKTSRPFIVSLPADNLSRRLWLALADRFFYAVFDYFRHIRPDLRNPDLSTQDALNMLDVLQLETNEPSEFNERLEQTRKNYNQHVPTQQATREAPQRPKPTIQLEASDIQRTLELLTRLPQEGAKDFLWRVHKARLALTQEHEPKLSAGDSESVRYFFHLSQQWDTQFREILTSFSDDDKREILLETCHHGEIGLHSLGNWWKDKDLLQPLLPALESIWPEALKAYVQADKVEIYSHRGASPQLQAAHFRMEYIWMFVGEAGGIKSQFALIQRALKSKAKKFVPEWEGKLLTQLSYTPKSYEAWLEWKLDESYDEILDHLASRAALQNPFYLDQTYTQMAIAIYRRYTWETRPRCYEFACMARVPSLALFEVIGVHRDEQAWLEILKGAQGKSPDYFPFWEVVRNDEERRERVTTSVFEALSGSTTESAAAMMMEMLEQVTPEELQTHAYAIAHSIESADSKVAKWSLEKLLKMPDASWDWPQIVNVTAEKLWGENIGLAKLAIRVLGIVPSADATVAWEKLEEALALENLTIVEACTRSLIELKRHSPTLSLSTSATERLEELAQLAPERFAKRLTKLQTT